MVQLVEVDVGDKQWAIFPDDFEFGEDDVEVLAVELGDGRGHLGLNSLSLFTSVHKRLVIVDEAKHVLRPWLVVFRRIQTTLGPDLIEHLPCAEHDLILCGDLLIHSFDDLLSVCRQRRDLLGVERVVLL